MQIWYGLCVWDDMVGTWRWSAVFR